ncbi:hypothetical protein SPAR_31511 [Streptomyces sparsogenes DSM 40356]|uniref:Uncharacterized protein n=1 Tax=Streptomyces sparsogenes DSM 40356 TaxID=1331668 RepID=A0A1R1SAE7_9ACTN|nr:hypothetical protein SPAR_31511 [Streptomyces sparsogenes DSM 40356]
MHSICGVRGRRRVGAQAGRLHVGGRRCHEALSLAVAVLVAQHDRQLPGGGQAAVLGALAACPLCMTV